MGLGKRNRELARLQLKSAWWCTPTGKTITMEELANPDYVPWILYRAVSPPKGGLDPWSSLGVYKWFNLMYEPLTGDLYWSIVGELGKSYPWHRAKPTKKIYKILMGKIEQIQVTIYSRSIDIKANLMGFKGKSTLSSGFVYAPYVPQFKSPKVDLSQFSVSKRRQYGNRNKRTI
jgi:hypothetical protein